MKRVLLLLCNGTEIYEAAAFYDVLGWADREGSERIETVTAGLRQEVICTFGLRIKPQTLLSAIDPTGFDALAVPGGFEEYGFYEDAYSEEVSVLVRAFEGAGKPIAAVCVGALPVAKSGVLQGRCATTYALSGGRRRRQLADLGASVEDRAFVVDGNIATSTGPSTAVNVAFWLLERMTDGENRKRIQSLMGFSDGVGEDDSFLR